MNYGILVDLILAALFLGSVYLCARSGFVKTVAVGLAACIALGSSYFIAQRLTPYVANGVVNPLIEKVLESSFEKHLTEDTLGALDSGMDTVETLIRKVREKFADPETIAKAEAEAEEKEAETEALFSDSEAVAKKITAIIGGAITACILFFLFFALILAILRTLIDHLDFLNRIPIIGPVNAILGFLVGIAVGYVLLAGPIWAVCRLVPEVLGDMELFTPETLQKSRVVSFMLNRMG
ncbi:MAG: hypothetical protein E7458_10170 [Ruminococcaceae bacterium]|nr:hypothetical protein [Oscillospiraceae bacterium]